jgi:hypothetical protein
MADHHHVPQLYLRNFIDPISGDKRDPYLWVADLVTGSPPKPRAPKNVAKASGYYDWKQLGAEVPELERHYGKIENAVAPVVRKLARYHFALDPEERYVVSRFVAYQVSRVPATHEILGRWLQNSALRHGNRLLKDQVWLTQRMYKHLQQNPDSTVPVNSVRSYIDRATLSVEFPSDLPLAVSVILAEGLIEPIFLMHWAFLKATGRRDFFSSNQPVYFLTEPGKPLQTVEIDGQRLIRVGGSNENLELLMPMSPRVALRLHAQRTEADTSDPEILRSNDERTLYFNLTLLQANRTQAYCSSEGLARWVTQKSQQQRAQTACR